MGLETKAKHYEVKKTEQSCHRQNLKKAKDISLSEAFGRLNPSSAHTNEKCLSGIISVAFENIRKN